MRFFHYFLYTVFVSSAHKPNSLPVFCYPKLCWWDDPTKQLSIMEQKPQWYDVRSVYMDGMTERMDKGSKNCATTAMTIMEEKVLCVILVIVFIVF